MSLSATAVSPPTPGDSTRLDLTRIDSVDSTRPGATATLARSRPHASLPLYMCILSSRHSSSSSSSATSNTNDLRVPQAAGTHRVSTGARRHQQFDSTAQLIGMCSCIRLPSLTRDFIPTIISSFSENTLALHHYQ